MLLRRAKGMIILAVVLMAVAVPTLVFAQSGWNNQDNRWPGERRAKNVILFIGDGIGDSEITIARNYYVGAKGRLNLDTLPFTGAMTTYAVQESNPALPDYVPDSASTGSGWATGTKTSNGRISTTAGTDKDLPTILELAQKSNYATGNVSTAEITDATPAVLASHVSARGCQGPADMKSCPQDKKSAGGPGSIAEQLTNHKLNVLLGGGKKRFDQTIDGGAYAGKTVTQSAVEQGYTVVTDAEGLKSAKGNQVLGLFNASNMSLEWSGAPAAPFPGSGPQQCVQDQRPANEPALADMTTKAIDLLAKVRGKNGFFLQVEGASIDKQDHAANPCGQIGETIGFDKAVKVGLEYAKRNPDTLVIVTGDHGHTSQIIPEPTEPTQPGSFSKLITTEGAVMTVSYASAPVGSSQEHTGTQIRIAALGPQAQRLTGVVDQTEIFKVVVDALRLRR